MNLCIVIIANLVFFQRIKTENFRMPQTGQFSYHRHSLTMRPYQVCVKCARHLTTSHHKYSHATMSVQRNLPRVSNIRSIFKHSKESMSNLYQISTERTYNRRFYDADAPYINFHVPDLNKTRYKPQLHADRPGVGRNQTTEENMNVSSSTENLEKNTKPPLLVNNKKIPPTINTTSDENNTVNLRSGNQIPTKDISDNVFFDIKNDTLINFLDHFECRFYGVNFDKLSGVSSVLKRGVSEISFVQSGLFLALAFIAFTTEVDHITQNEIDLSLGVPISNLSDSEKVNLITQVIESLPHSNDGLHFRWSSHLVLCAGREVSDRFKNGVAAALQLKIGHFERKQTPTAMAKILNQMIEKDSGAIRDTFEESDLTDNEAAVFMTTLYIRARWRSAPTLLNGTWPFHHSANTTSRGVRMIRINDVMKYATLPNWEAEAIEIPYSTEGLTLLILLPRSNSLKDLVDHVTKANLSSVVHNMKSVRLAVKIPLFTLRMTLLLPNKLEAMGISRLVNSSGSSNGTLSLSKAIQRIMFWAEAGRNAYKDDGLEWEATPEKEIVVDRPYIFFVRWNNLTILNGNLAF